MIKADKIEVGKSTISLYTPDLRLIKIGKRPKSYDMKTVDFFINGKNLRTMIAENNENAPDNTTNLSNGYPPEERTAYVSRLAGEYPGDLDSGRVALLTCPIDGDLACGAVGCRVRRDDEAGTVTWYDFAWDGNFADYETNNADDDEYEKVRGIKEFVFDKQDYMELMNEFIKSS